MSGRKGESTLPYLHGKSKDLFKGKFNLQVLSVVGHGYAGQVVKCVLNRPELNVYGNAYHRGQTEDRSAVKEDDHPALSSDIAHQVDRWCGGSTDLAQDDDDQTFSSDDVEDDPDVSQSAHREYRDELIAIKILNKVKTQPCSVENEVKLLCAARGPNVIQYITSVECLDSYWILTEFCSRGDLHGLLKHMDDSYIMARFFMCDVLSGLECLHQQCIAHSDVKMKNILISDNNVAKLADFGFAKMYSSTKDTESEARGTKDYWAPEMCLDDSLFNPFKADIYALGVTFAGVCRKKPIKKKYDNVLTVVRTFEDLSQRELFNGILHTDPEQRFYFADMKRNSWLAERQMNFM
ncbi:hypothetical protein Btru_035742 [Bulinus truncatus]|nr:hypothetical protein Btru_035742 [Bulinus truncatus]